MARVWLTGGAALLAVAISAHARAQECTSDADCDDGSECDLGPVAMQDCSGSASSTPDAGSCDPNPTPRRGECEARKMTCDTDADCVTGLTCLHRQDSAGCTSPATIDAGVSKDVDCAAPEPGPGECVLELVACEKDSDCDDGLECAPIGRTSTCDVSASAGLCMPGQACTPPEQMENCTESVTSYFCFPPRVDCTRDADCDDGARCVELPDDAKKNPPPGWEGASALCFSEAFALALEKRVEFEGGGGTKSEDSNADSASGGDSKGGGRGASGSAQGDTDSAAPSKTNDVEVEHSDVNNDDGCAVSTTSAMSSRAWMLFGVAALWLRRRRDGER